jgi:hypothetical protein
MATFRIGISGWTYPPWRRKGTEEAGGWASQINADLTEILSRGGAETQRGEQGISDVNYPHFSAVSAVFAVKNPGFKTKWERALVPSRFSEAAINLICVNPRFVLMKTRVGGTRVMDMLSGEQRPRICRGGTEE